MSSHVLMHFLMRCIASNENTGPLTASNTIATLQPSRLLRSLHGQRTSPPVLSSFEDLKNASEHAVGRVQNT